MKIIAMCNDRLQVFADNMQESLRRVGLEAAIHHLDDPPGTFKTDEFRKICYKKLEIITAELADDETLLYVDVDVVFRKDPIEDLCMRLCGCDVVFQQEEPIASPAHIQKGPHVWGAGFFAVHPTTRGKALVAPRREGEYNKWEWHSDAGLLGTRLARKHLSEPPVHAALLPHDLYPSGWYQLNTVLNPDRFACHYNWTVSAESKIRRMKEEGDWLI